jgi:hypothetical protein
MRGEKIKPKFFGERIRHKQMSGENIL